MKNTADLGILVIGPVLNVDSDVAFKGFQVEIPNQ